MERPSVESVPSGKALSIATAPHVAENNALPVGRWPGGPQTGALRAHPLEDGHTRAGFQPRKPRHGPQSPARLPECGRAAPAAEGRGPDTGPIGETPRHRRTPRVHSEGRTEPQEMRTRHAKPRARVCMAALCPPRGHGPPARRRRRDQHGGLRPATRHCSVVVRGGG